MKIIAKVSQALAGPYEELLALLPQEDTLNVDETGHKNNKVAVLDLVLPRNCIPCSRFRRVAARMC